MSSDDERPEEPLPPLPIDPGLRFSWRHVAIIVGIATVSAFLRCLGPSDDAPRTMVVTDPGAGLPPAERAALEEAIRRGDPLVLGPDGRLHRGHVPGSQVGEIARDWRRFCQTRCASRSGPSAFPTRRAPCLRRTARS